MLPKKEKISRKDFATVFKHSKTVSRGSFFVLKRQETAHFSLSVVISKKVAKKATERNYLKRIAYELFREIKKKKPSLVGSFIFMFQNKPESFNLLKNDVEKNCTLFN